MEDGFDVIDLTFTKKKPQATALTAHHHFQPAGLLLRHELNPGKHISRTFL